MTVDGVSERLRRLVMERQALRERGAGADDLERNRLEIVRAQWELSYLCIDLHRRQALPKAA